MADAEEGPEALLVAIAKRRDRAAFAALFRSLGPRVKAHFIARSLTETQADDLTQEVMLRVWRNAEQYDAARGAASTWVYSIARNCFVDQIRRERRPEVELDDPTRVEAELSAEEAIAAAESAAAIGAALARLPDEQGAVIQEVYFAGKSLPEVAQARALPLGTVKTRARLALERLRLLLVRK